MPRISAKWLIAAITTSATLIALFLGTNCYQFFRHVCIRERTLFAIPETNFEIEHSRIGNNPIVAEYDRDVVIIENGNRGSTTPLAIDTCGGYPINCYLITTPENVYLRLDDSVSEHLLDLTNQTVNLITYAKGMAYYGKLTNAKSLTDWSISGEDLSTLKVTVCGNPTSPLTEIISYDKGTYIGRITGGRGKLRFIAASDSPESSIAHSFAR